MNVAVGSDLASPVVDAVRAWLDAHGHAVVDIGLRDGSPWPDVGTAVATSVARGESDLGVVCCWTGTGVSIAANKVSGVRAALCTDAETARGARRWNDANVLAFGLRLTTEAVALELVEAFLETGPDGTERDNIAKLDGR